MKNNRSGNKNPNFLSATQEGQYKIMDKKTIADLKKAKYWPSKNRINRVNKLVNEQLKNSPSFKSDLAILYQLELLANSTNNSALVAAIHEQFAVRFYIAKMIDEKTITNTNLNNLYSLKKKLDKGNPDNIFDNIFLDIARKDSKIAQELLYLFDTQEQDLRAGGGTGNDDNNINIDAFKKLLKGCKTILKLRKEVIDAFDSNGVIKDGEGAIQVDLLKTKLNNSEQYKKNFIADLINEKFSKYTQSSAVTIFSKNIDDDKLYTDLFNTIRLIIDGSTIESQLSNPELKDLWNFDIKYYPESKSGLSMIDYGKGFISNLEDTRIKKIQNLINFGVKADHLYRIAAHHHPQVTELPTNTSDKDIKNHLIAVANAFRIFGTEIKSQIIEDLVKKLELDQYKDEELKNLSEKLEEMKTSLSAEIKDNWSIKYAIDTIQQAVSQRQEKIKNDTLKEMAGNVINEDIFCEEALNDLAKELKDLTQEKGREAAIKNVRSWVGEESHKVTYNTFLKIKNVKKELKNELLIIEELFNYLNTKLGEGKISLNHERSIDPLEIQKTSVIEIIEILKESLKLDYDSEPDDINSNLLELLKKIDNVNKLIVVNNDSLNKDEDKLNLIFTATTSNNQTTLDLLLGKKIKNVGSGGDSNEDPAVVDRNFIADDKINEANLKGFLGEIYTKLNIFCTNFKTTQQRTDLLTQLLLNPADSQFPEKVDVILTMFKASLENDKSLSQSAKEGKFKEFIEEVVNNAIKLSGEKKIKELLPLNDYFADDNYFGPEKLPHHLDALQFIKQYVGKGDYSVESLFEKYLNSNSINTSDVFTITTPRIDDNQKEKTLKYNRQRTDNGYIETCFKSGQSDTSVHNSHNDLVAIEVNGKSLLTSLDGPSVRKSGKTFDVAFAYTSDLLDVTGGTKTSAPKDFSEKYHNKALLPVKLNGEDYLVEVTFQINDGYGSYYYSKKTDITIRLLQKQNVQGSVGGYSEVASATSNGSNVKWNTVSFVSTETQKAIKELENYNFNIVSRQCERSIDGTNKVALVTKDKLGNNIEPKTFSLEAGKITKGNLGSDIEKDVRGKYYRFKDGALTFGQYVEFKRKPREGRPLGSFGALFGLKQKRPLYYFGWNTIYPTCTGLTGERFDVAITDLLSGGISKNLNNKKPIVIDLSESPRIYNIKSLVVLVKELKDKGYEIKEIKLDGCKLWGRDEDKANRTALDQISQILGDRLVIKNDINVEGLKRLIKTQKKGDKSIDLSKYGHLQKEELIKLDECAVENGKKVKFSKLAHNFGMFKKENFTEFSIISLFLDLGHADSKKTAKQLSRRLIKGIEQNYLKSDENLKDQKEKLINLQKEFEKKLKSAGSDKAKIQEEISKFRKKIGEEYLKDEELPYLKQETHSYYGQPFSISQNTDFLRITSSLISDLTQLGNIMRDHPNLRTISFDDKCSGKSSDEIHKFFEKISKEINRNINITTENPATTIYHPRASRADKTMVTGVQLK